MKVECTMNYEGVDPPDHGCVTRSISKSPLEYLRQKMVRDGGKIAVGLSMFTSDRYGTRTTPTTRRTSYDTDLRKYC
jgi:hypothetical protein